MGIISAQDVCKIQKYLKNNLLNDDKFVGFDAERDQLLNLMKQTIECGESNSALLLGSKGCGKTTLINDILSELEVYFKSDAVLVKLHGLVHTDDRLALKSATTQMNLDNAVDGKVFGSFADNLSFLLACLKSGQKQLSKSVIFVIDEFDLFCSHHNQTLLYNLFDIAQSAQTPICVLGITSRLDVIELLEKRVKSRFSHRQILLFSEQHENDLKQRLVRLQHFLTIPDSCKLIPNSVKKWWNSQMKYLLAQSKFKNLMERLMEIDLSEQTLKNTLFVVISQLSEENCVLTAEMFAKELDKFENDDIIIQLKDLSILELCLIIAMKHHYQIYEQPMNFEMILTRFTKFVNANSGMQSLSRAVAMKAFEHLECLELISPLSGSQNSNVQKEYQLYKLLVLPQQVSEAVKKIAGLPTEVVQWANSSLV